MALGQFGSRVCCLNPYIVGRRPVFGWGGREIWGSPGRGETPSFREFCISLSYWGRSVTSISLRPRHPGLLTGSWGARLLPLPHPPPPPPPTPVRELTFLVLAAPGRPSRPLLPSRPKQISSPSAYSCSTIGPPGRQQGPSTPGCHFHSRCSGQWQQPRLPGKSGGQIGWPALSGVSGPLSVIFCLTPQLPLPGVSA